MENIHLLQRLPRKTIVQHPAAQFGVHCMKGDIDGGEMIPAYSVNIMLRHIRQRHIITLQEGESGVIILEIQSFPHIRRHLVYKAENTLIPAAPVRIHKPGLKFDSQILVEVLLNLQKPLFSVSFLNQDLNIGILNQKLIVKYIFDFLLIDRQQQISCFDFQFFGNAPGQNALDSVRFSFHGSFFFRGIFIHIICSFSYYL